MTEQKACTLCGAGGHTAAQCSWNKASAKIAVNTLRAGLRTLADYIGPKCRNAVEVAMATTCLDDTAQPSEQAEGAQGELSPDMAQVYDLIGLHHSQLLFVLLTNFKNMKRFSELLHAVEREFFMVPGEPSSDPEDEGCEPDDECLVNSWGSTQEKYIEQFRAALETLQARAALTRVAAMEQQVPVAHRLINAHGEVMTDWHDGPPPANFTDLCGVAMAGTRVELAFAQAGQVPDIDSMVSRFLAWPLPANVCADLCATMPGEPYRSGTNLLSGEQAKVMLEYVLAAAPQPAKGE